MTEHVKTQLKRKSTAEKRKKIRFCLLGILLLTASGALLFHNGRFPVSGEINNWFAQNNPPEVKAAAPAANRGNIYDRNYRPLAATYKTYAICARPLEMDDSDNAAGILAEILHLKKSRLLQELKSERGFIWVAKGIDQETADLVKQKNIKGIYQVVETNRFYPNSEMAAHVVGFVEYGQGLDGIEYHYNALLRGDEISKEELAALNIAPENIVGETMAHLVLNLDLMLQAKVEDYIEKRMITTGAVSGSAILMNANTGAVYSMVSFPSFNPNHYWEFSSTALRNNTVSEPVFPGELALIFQQAAALNKFHEEKGSLAGDREVMDGLVLITPDKKKRRRNSAAPPVDYVAPEELAEFAKRLGFDKKLSTDLAMKDEPPTEPSIALTGSSFNTSALRLLNGFTALVNGGRLLTPHLLYTAYQKDNPVPIGIFPGSPDEERILDPETSNDLKKFLAAKWLKLPGRGMTPDRSMFFEAHHYVMPPENSALQETSGKAAVETFPAPEVDQTVMLGALPGKDPKLTMIAVLTYPDRSASNHPDLLETFGKSLSFLSPGEEMIQKMLQVANIEPPQPAPGFWDSERTFLAGKTAGAPPGPDGRETLPGDIASTMPDVTGKSLRAGLQILQHLNLDIKLVGTGRIYSQHPAAGTRLTDITECTLKMQREI